MPILISFFDYSNMSYITHDEIHLNLIMQKSKL